MFMIEVFCTVEFLRVRIKTRILLSVISRSKCSIMLFVCSEMVTNA